MTLSWQAREPSAGEVAIAALVRVLLILMICLATWVLVTIKAINSSSPEVWWALLAGIVLFVLDFAYLAKRKGREWDMGWSLALLIYGTVAGTALVLSLLEYRYLVSTGTSIFGSSNTSLYGSTITLYGADSLTLYVSYVKLLQLTSGYVFLTAATGMWLLSRGRALAAEHRYNILLITLCQAADSTSFGYTFLTCSGASDDLYTALMVTVLSLSLLHFCFDPAPNYASATPDYDVGTGCRKCVSNQFVRLIVPLVLHELPMLVVRVLLMVDAEGLFSTCVPATVYFFVSKNAFCFIYLFTWMIIAACRGCTAEGTNLQNIKSEDVIRRKSRHLSANRRRIKAAITMRNRVGMRTGYM